MADCFINFSNHPSEKWNDRQKKAAKDMVHDGEIIDIPFPDVKPQLTTEEVYEEALAYVNKILKLNPACVMCQGEFTLAFKVVELLKEKGIAAVAACSKRITEEHEGKKTVYFEFERFRNY